VEGERTRRTGFTASLFALGLGVVVLLIGLLVGSEDALIVSWSPSIFRGSWQAQY
jgi:hypothetical protein